MQQMIPPFHGLPSGTKIMLAFSGGVDSAVAAHLCKEAGLDVLAVNMRFLPGAERTEEEVRSVADALKIPLQFLDLRSDFRELVMRRCWDVFDSGKTPNPCAICNPVFKFGRMLEFAEQNQCKALATGHYVQKVLTSHGRPALCRGIHKAKDQSYFLFGLTPEQVERACFPLGNMEKDDVRAIADRLGLPNAKAKESQDACFTPPDGSLAEMLRQEFGGKTHPGCFIHAETGKILGRHKGIHAYTIGQRKGTGVALGTPAYVRQIDAAHGNVYITADEQTLFQDVLLAENVNWQSVDPQTEPFRAMVQIRYRSPAAPATVTPLPDGTCEVRFDQPLRAITPGQAAVFYGESNDAITGGGFIR